MTEALPPIMQTRGLYLVSIGTTAEGYFCMEFHAPAGSPVKEVVVILSTDTDEPVVPIYSYSIRDKATSTYAEYSGIHGDRDLDEMLSLGGL